MIGGIDEAGRGPVLGPMVIAGYFLDEKHFSKISEIAKRDSKGYTPRERERIFHTLLNYGGSKVVVITLHPSIIDNWVSYLGGLNQMEAYYCYKIITTIKPRKVYIDSCDTHPQRFLNRIMRYLTKEKINLEINVDINADIKYPIVSAASIIAKVIRDSYILKLKEEFGELGSGYPSDPTTKKFLSTWIEKYNIPPPFSRKTWKTISKVSKGLL